MRCAACGHENRNAAKFYEECAGPRPPTSSSLTLGTHDRRTDEPESRNLSAVHDHSLQEHRLGSHPETVVAVKSTVDDELLVRLRVARATEYFVSLSLIVLVHADLKHRQTQVPCRPICRRGDARMHHLDSVVCQRCRLECRYSEGNTGCGSAQRPRLATRASACRSASALSWGAYRRNHHAAPARTSS
jgi:hypothetical protein